MKTIARVNSLISLLVLGMTSHMAMATPMVDAYVGGDDHGYGDIIGASNHFDVMSIDVNRSGNMLYVDVFTNFAGKGDNGLFSGYTNTPASNGNGIGYGDLFLATEWNPDDSQAGYLSDNHATGTIWEYGFALDNRWSANGGMGQLYSLNSGNNDANSLLSEDFLSGAVYRDGQEIAVDTNSDVSALGLGGWQVNQANKQISFVFDLTGTSLLSSDTIALHWAMTCGNDVIEAEFPMSSVPEPAALSMLSLGLLGFMARRKSNS